MLSRVEMVTLSKCRLSSLDNITCDFPRKYIVRNSIKMSQMQKQQFFI